jgi:hypothetical protein
MLNFDRTFLLKANISKAALKNKQKRERKKGGKVGLLGDPWKCLKKILKIEHSMLFYRMMTSPRMVC